MIGSVEQSAHCSQQQLFAHNVKCNHGATIVSCVVVIVFDIIVAAALIVTRLIT